jgi:hypothetical protein
LVGPTRDKMVILLTGLTMLARNIDGMAHR